MDLEEEIKQKKFRNEHHKAVVNILYTSNWMSYSQLQFMKKYSITPQQYNILRILRGQYPAAATVNLLIDRMLDKMSNASRLVEKLKTKELVERKISQEDKRKVEVVITQKGLDLLERMEIEINTEEDGYKSSITEEEAKELNRLLDKLRG